MRINVLGWPMVYAPHSGATRLIGEKARVLLALLACRNEQTTSADLLIEGLWGYDPPKSSTANLQTYIWRIRRLLAAAEPDGESRLVHSSGAYGLWLDPRECDVLEMQCLHDEALTHLRQGHPAQAADLLRRACALWRGSPFSTHAADRSAVVVGELRRCEELRLRVCEEYVATTLSLGEAGQQAALLRRLVAEYPLRERLHVLLVRSLWSNGDHGAALVACQEARETLHRELGTQPSHELRHLHQAILTGSQID